MDRKQKIIDEIKKSNKPISATKLASLLGVSRQIIVGDVALIRASGTNIIATPRGYVLDQQNHNDLYTIAVKHSQEELADELYTIVDMGGSIIDVIVDHAIYGQLTGKLHIASRYDVEQFLKRVNAYEATPLSQLTDGIHLHTIQCQDQDIYHRIIQALDEKGYLLKK